VREAVAKQGARKGDFLGGKYLLGDCLGIGGMGEVYRAQNVSLGRHVAIKILSEEFKENEEDVRRFLREARAAAAVRHPNVVDVLDVARDDDGTPFIVQELLAGQDLEQHLQASGGRMMPVEVLDVMIPVAEAVGASHHRGVVHRDLKPANIFLAREGSKVVPKVLDFGAALYKTVGGLSAKEQRMLIGTPHYMAPEQITTKTDVDARADVWALGIIIYELLVGETPFEAETADAVLKAVRTRNVPPLREGAPRAPAELERLVAQCTHRDKAKRLVDANAVRDELGAIRDATRGDVRKQAETLVQRGSEPPPPPSARLPSLVLSTPNAPTRRRGSAVLTLSSPESDAPPASRADDDLGIDDPPASVERPIESAPDLDVPSAAERKPSPPPSEPKRDRGLRHLMELEGGDSGPLELQLERAHTPAPTATSPPPASPGPGRRH
jgi:serine/threonine-protein kinase